VLVKQNGVFLDLSSGERMGVDIGLLGVNESEDDKGIDTIPVANELFWSKNKFAFRIYSSNVVTSFENFQALERVMCFPQDTYTRHCQ
jgi:hypothetical protein